MKRLLMAFTAIAAVAAPLAAALPALAQEEPTPPSRERPMRERERGPRPEITRDADAPTMIERARPRPERTDAETPRRNPPERPQGGWNRPDQPRPERPERPEGWNRPEQPRPERPEGWNRPDRPDRPGGWNRPDRPRPEQPGPNRPDRPGASRPDRPDQEWNRPDRPGRPGSGWNRPDRPDRPSTRPGQPGRPGWDRGPDRDRRHEEFRRRFDSDQWRRDFYRNHRSDWWRNDRRFRGYTGVRVGFYFAPGWGYYSVPRSYWGRSWSVGQYLPDVFWRYQLNDWRTYGLGYPPPGTRWVLVDNSIYLIDDFDGYIIEVVRNAWSW
ncbi:MAG: RcnB family protein [Proteobacteria bacterium]|nr:RcnB family protein [Pseudomonadota bacterium]